MTTNLIDITTLTLQELRQMHVDIAAELAERQAKARIEAATLVRNIAADAGISIEELFKLASSKGVKPNRPARDAKYRNPANAEETWSGYGRKPGWVKNWLEAGKPIEELEVKPS
jgi:DNA-binding protein H-NS